ncbi:hypothetical protein AOL_s00169g94 [Orbilia oligospora ATCC 24927]|uniref:polynucleotide adenylyltransferase n=1 Tax=Arthrobotrys oligospora (strain ATCC 24927 / CBS 115.81 / DSM 1491) TaxID=756982 RepID=G1XMP1_ARTOA|nr:hypothetical protein AOL_s00169g94 [Orbilia oligospora ATCC 24927]EGX45488.1 hypothetical protein AOL_s00169g94 [Orbilia oligospora ATCC 24927]
MAHFQPSSSPNTALALVLPESTMEIIQPLRSFYDAAAIKWPPHLNLFYPFVHPSAIESVSEYLTEHLHTIFKVPLSIRFGSVEVFGGGKKRPSFLVLRPDKESEELIQDFYELLGREFPEVRNAVTRKEFKPHLTIGQVYGGNEGKIFHFQEKFKMLCKAIGEVEVGLATMQRVEGKMTYVRTWGVKEYPFTLSLECVPGSVVKRDTWTYKSAAYDSGDEGSENHEDREEEQTLNKWERVNIVEETKTAGRSLTLSTYNVFVDTDNTKNQDSRWWAICKKLIASNSTIICLQEVSDGCLAMIGNSWEVRQKYPYISHSPEKPLLRLRNCIILSSVPFSWEEVSTDIQGRSICLAKFDQFGFYSTPAPIESEDEDAPGPPTAWHPLIVANVHLPAYHTDEAVKLRTDYVGLVKSHLDTNYPGNPVIIVGDMNIANDTSISHAVTHKIITESSGAAYGDLFPPASYADAWLVSGEGLEGNTFDPATNSIAFENAGHGSSIPIVPQRYDRIYVRLQGGDNLLIREARVVLDTSVPPSSDHYMLTSKLSFIDSSKQPTPETLLSLPQTALQDSDLIELLKSNSCFPTPAETALRHQAVASLTACLNGLPDLTTAPENSSDTTFTLRLVPVGSFGLGTYTSTSDTDILAIGSISTPLFWRIAKQRIKRFRGKAADSSSLTSSDALSVKIVRYVDATIPMLILLIGDKIRIDLQYTTAVSVLSNFDTIPFQPLNSPLWNLTVPTLKKLQAWRDLLFLLSRIPNLAKYRLAYRFIKLWAEKKGVYSSKFGFFGGVHISLLLARVAMLLPPTATASQLIAAFFTHYSTTKWDDSVIFMPGTGKVLRYQRATRDKMVILTINTPVINVAANATIHTVHTLSSELEKAAAKFELDATFSDVVGSFGDDTSKEIPIGVNEFLGGYNRYIKVDVQFWGLNRQGGRALVGWVESRLVGLLVELGRQTPGLDARIWPGRFHETKAQQLEAEEGADGEQKEEKKEEMGELRGFYLVALSPSSKSSQMTKEEKRNGEAAFAAVLRNFETAVTKHKEKYDPSTSWISVSCVKPDEFVTEKGNTVELDLTMVWDGGEADENGDGIPDDEDSEEEEDPDIADLLLDGEEAEDEDDFFGSLRKGSKKNKNASAVTQKNSGPTAKLRPSHEVFNRLKWDSKYDASAYVIGYEDRFRGVLEIGVDKWKTEMSDEEFVPMHRVVYFKERKTGEMLWDREKRIDKIFGSGNTADGKKKGKK